MEDKYSITQFNEYNLRLKLIVTKTDKGSVEIEVYTTNKDKDSALEYIKNKIKIPFNSVSINYYSTRLQDDSISEIFDEIEPLEEAKT